MPVHAADRRRPDIFLILAVVCAMHVAALWALTTTFSRAPSVLITPPAIVGVLVSEEQSVTPPEALSMETQPQPQPVPHTPEQVPVPPLQAPPSERAATLPPPESAPAAENPDMRESRSVPAMASDAEADGSTQPILPPRADAVFLDNPAPRYPQMSRRLREEGHVLLNVFIRADGSVGEVKLKRSSGFPRLDEAASDAVRRWRYVPAMRGQTPIDYWHVQPLDFELDP